MYLDLNVSKKGEIILPAPIRRKLKIREGGKVRVNVMENKVELLSPHQNAVEELCSLIKDKDKLPASKILMGDELYEEVF